VHRPLGFQQLALNHAKSRILRGMECRTWQDCKEQQPPAGPAAHHPHLSTYSPTSCRVRHVQKQFHLSLCHPLSFIDPRSILEDHYLVTSAPSALCNTQTTISKVAFRGVPSSACRFVVLCLHFRCEPEPHSMRPMTTTNP